MSQIGRLENGYFSVEAFFENIFRNTSQMPFAFILTELIKQKSKKPSFKVRSAVLQLHTHFQAKLRVF